MHLKQAAFVFLCFLLLSCSGIPRPAVAIFQTKQTLWDEVLYTEMQASAAMYDGIDFSFNFSFSPEEEALQIDSAVRSGVKSIIVNALDVKHVLPSIEKAYNSGVYVVLVGNILPTKKFHSYSGVNNWELGIMAGHLVRKHLPNGGNIVELGGNTEQTWFSERMEGFHSIIEADKSVTVVSTVFGDWTQQTAHADMDSLSSVIGKDKVDLIFSYGDDMLIGAIKSGVYPDAIFIGTDGIPGESIHYVGSGGITSTIMTNTGGTEAIASAVDLIMGKACERLKYCPSLVVDRESAKVVSYSIEKLNLYSQFTTSISNDLKTYKVKLSHYEPAAYIALFLLFLIIVHTKVLVEKERAVKKINEEVVDTRQRCSELNSQIAEFEKNLQQLQTERSALLEVVTSPEATPPDEESSDIQKYTLTRFISILENHINDSDFTIGDIAAELGMSRAQLFRKIKSQSGETPNDLLQSMRLSKAREMLKNTDLTVAEVAYATGYTSPSYFAKCFKEKFGVLPSDVREQ